MLKQPCASTTTVEKQTGRFVFPHFHNDNPTQFRFRCGCFFSDHYIDEEMEQELNRLSYTLTNELLEHDLIPLLTGTGYVSVRFLYDFITIYSKRNETNYIMQDNETKMRTRVFVNREYLKQHKTHGGTKHFDFFRRGRVVYLFFKGEYYKTTISQLNCLLWAIDVGALEYAKRMKTEIFNNLLPQKKTIQ